MIIKQLYDFPAAAGQGARRNSYKLARLFEINCFFIDKFTDMRKQRVPYNGRASLGSWQGGVSFGSQLVFESPAFH